MNKNILFIHHVSCLAGAERYLLSLIEVLDKNYKVSFICQEPGPLTEELIRLGVTVEYMPLGAWRKLSLLWSNIKTIQKIIKFCRSKRIDLICSNNYRVSSYAVWPARLLRIPSMTIIQDFVPTQKLWKFNAFESDCLVTVSKSLSQNLKHRNIVNIYNGMDVDQVKRQLSNKDVLREEFPQLQGKRIVGMVAHIIPLKGHHLFFRAMKKISQIFPNTVFVIIGDSPHQKQLSMDDLKIFVKSLELHDRVIFTGDRKNALDLMKSFDILVHPSNREAFGRVVLEGMILGVPVIATKCGGPSEIIEHEKNGLLISVGDELGLVQAVTSLLSDETKRLNLGKNGQLRAETKFNLNNTIFQINSLMRSLLS